MRKIFLIGAIMLMVFGLFLQDAQAKRFGGGRSFGVSRSASSFTRTAAPAAPIFHQNTQAPSRASKWLGPLAGVAAGGLLASLFMGHGGGIMGGGGGILTWLVLGAIALFAWNLIRRNLSPLQSVQPSNFSNGNVMNDRFVPSTNNNVYQMPSSAVRSPNGFDEMVFLRETKVQFIRLQAAYDNKDLNDLREFTSPEVFAEIQLQFQERQDAVNHTEVVSLESRLLDVVDENQGLIASVHFSGMIKEETNQPAAPFAEVWHFRKTSIGKWIVVGIEQQ